MVDVFGEYYFPYPAYPTNCLFKENPFARQSVRTALKEVGEIASNAAGQSQEHYTTDDQALRDFLSLVGYNSTDHLRKRADQFHRILKAQVTVLQPDCRHVDYDVIPVMISEGCLYNCSFCEVKSGMDLSFRSRDEITEQLIALREFFKADLLNYNSIYLVSTMPLQQSRMILYLLPSRPMTYLLLGSPICRGQNFFFSAVQSHF